MERHIYNKLLRILTTNTTLIMLFSSSSFPVLLLCILAHSLLLTPSVAIPRVSTAAQFKTSSRFSARDGVDPCVEFFMPSNSMYLSFRCRITPLPTPSETLFLAEHAYRCLTSVPFDKIVASQFIQYYKDTLEFQKYPYLSQRSSIELTANSDRCSFSS